MTTSTQWLFEYGSGRPVAFTTSDGANWFTFDDRPWAVRRGDWLLPVDGGPAIGRFVGKWVYAASAAPLFYQGSATPA